MQALWTSKVNHLASCVTVQPHYNLMDRQIEQELIPCCQKYGIGVIPYSPLANGFLTGKCKRGQEFPKDGRMSVVNPAYQRIMTDINWNKLAKLEAFATERGHSVGELAIAWLLSRPWLSAVIAGARKVEQIKANSDGWD